MITAFILHYTFHACNVQLEYVYRLTHIEPHRKYNPREEVDDPEGAPEDLGEEWPDFEEPSIARQREFHQVLPFINL